jgi:type IV pilus assembly protein PilQ
MKLSLQKIIFLFTLNAVLLSPANATTINAIDFITLPGSRVQIILKMDKPPVEPKSFTIETPSRIAFDFLDTTSSLKRKVLPIGLGVAKSITTISVKDRTRVVLNLSSLTAYKTNIDGNNFNIIINTEDANLSEIESVSSQGDEAVEIISGQNNHPLGNTQ